MPVQFGTGWKPVPPYVLILESNFASMIGGSEICPDQLSPLSEKILRITIPVLRKLTLEDREVRRALPSYFPEKVK
jgi:hypothetical protein